MAKIYSLVEVEHSKLTEEYETRTKLLDALEVSWKHQGNLRFGQLIQNIMAQDDSTKYLEQNQIQQLSTVQWLSLVENADFVLSAHSPATQPERISLVIESLRTEWSSSKKSFGEFIIDHIKEHQPGAILYGYPDRFWLIEETGC